VNFPPLLYVLAFGSAFLVSLLVLPLWMRVCLRIGLVDDPGDRKIHSEPIPLAGGVSVMTGMAVPALAAALALYLHQPSPGHPNVPPESQPGELLLYGLNRRGIELVAIFVGALGMLLLGVWDDLRELRPQVKFAGQLGIALLVAAAGVRITLFVHSLAFSYLISVLWTLTVINAFNFMDNMNGLCAGLGAIGSFCIALVAALAGQYLVALIAFLACGALLGFLPHNFPRARAFLGDAGSHLVGYLLAVLAILPHFYTHKHPRVLAVLSPLVILAIPLVDLVRVVWIRFRLGRPFYLGDNNHLSHRLVAAGMSRPGAVAWIWLAAAIAGALGVWLG